MKVDLVDYKVDPNKKALQMCYLPDSGGNTFFRSERHNRGPNIPHDEVCIFFSYLYIFRSFNFF